jgi:hypothetical protein
VVYTAEIAVLKQGKVTKKGKICKWKKMIVRGLRNTSESKMIRRICVGQNGLMEEGFVKEKRT